MTPRSSGTIEICFGPVPFLTKAYSVASERSVAFSQVHALCGTKVEQQYFCAADDAVVPRPAIARQYRLPDGTVTLLTNEDLSEAASDQVGTLEIVEFIPEGCIDPVYFGKALLLGPIDKGHDSYSTFVDALEETRTSAVGIHYMPTRDQLVVLERYGKRGLLLRELFYASELRAIEQVELPESNRARLLDGAFEKWTDAIARRRKDTFSAGEYADGYPERVRLAAERKGTRGAAPGATVDPTELRRAARARIVEGRSGDGAQGDRKGPASVRELASRREEPPSETMKTTR